MKYLKYLLISVLALLMFSFVQPGKHRKPNLPAKATVGHVQFLQEITYRALMDSTGEISKGDIVSDTDNAGMVYGRKNNMPGPGKNPEPPIQTWAYNEYGDEIENAKYHANGKISSRTTHLYYENGDIKEVIDSSFPLHGGVPEVRIQQYTYTYDTKGNRLLTNYWEYEATNRKYPAFSRTVNSYDSAGYLRRVAIFNGDTINPVGVTWSMYNAKGKLVETDERKRDANAPALAAYERNDFWYDDKGRMYDKATYHAHIGLVKNEKITFDSNRKTVVTYSYGPNKALTGTVVKQTFNNTHIVQEDTYDAGGLLTDYTISHFDSAKHLLDKGVFHINRYRADNRYMAPPTGNGNKADDTVMVHHIVNDDHYNCIVDDNFSNDGKAIYQKSYQYNYDSTGNWIDKIQYNIDKPVIVTERKIGYFKD